jgi:hypothetical protein
MGCVGEFHTLAPGSNRMNKTHMPTRRSVVGVLFATPLALSIPAVSARSPMTVDQAISHLFAGVFLSPADPRTRKK